MSDRKGSGGGCCARCGGPLGRDDVGLFRKLVFRGAETGFLCKACLAEDFRCDTALLDKKIRQFRAAGCLLFQEAEEG